MATQSSVLVPYVPTQYPAVNLQNPGQVDPKTLQLWLTSEHAKLKTDIGLLVQVVKELDARLIVGGL
jgi:hypothetical protein